MRGMSVDSFHVQCSGRRSHPHPTTDVTPKERNGRWVYNCPVCCYDQSVAAVPERFSGTVMDIHEMACRITAGEFPR